MTTLLEEGEELMADGAPNRDVRIEGLLREWNIPFEFEDEVELNKLDADYNDSQVRRSEHRAPRENVDEYAIQMRNGANFPPMVITHNRRMIDGNTRKAAAEQIGRETFPAYLVKLPQATFGPMIGAALNQMGGKRLSTDEAYDAAETMFRNGISDEAIARTIGKSMQSVRNYRKQARFQDTAARLDLQDVKIQRTSQEALSEIKLDEPFKAATQLADEAKLAPRDVKELVSQLNETRSEAEALSLVAEARTKHAPAGPPPRKQNQTKAATDAGRKLDTFLKAITAPPAQLAPVTLRAELEPKWKQVHDLAGAVLQAFSENPDPESEDQGQTE